MAVTLQKIGKVAHIGDDKRKAECASDLLNGNEASRGDPGFMFGDD